MSETKETLKMTDTIKLTQYVAKGGCACKLGPQILAKVLQGISFPTSPQVLVDSKTADDAGVYRLSEDMALVQTVDFFTPMVDEPFLFGAISAANALSDVYAMGGKPLTALNLVAFPIPLVEKGVLREVLAGAMEVLAEAGVALIGGHSIENETPVFGMTVTGTVHPAKIWTNSGAQAGDALVLTKPLGTGILNLAHKGELFPAGVKAAQQSMRRLNAKARDVAAAYTVHACTDVTGFSLAGHGAEMAQASGVSLHINLQALPLLPQACEAAAMGLVPAASYGNRKALKEQVVLNNIAPVWEDIVFDPQTSGGLLLAVPSVEGVGICQAMAEEGLEAALIGEVREQDTIQVYFY